MYVCLCNPFTDKDVKEVLKQDHVKKTPAHIYKEASGGAKPCCGSCICTIREMVDAS